MNDSPCADVLHPPAVRALAIPVPAVDLGISDGAFLAGRSERLAIASGGALTLRYGPRPADI